MLTVHQLRTEPIEGPGNNECRGDGQTLTEKGRDKKSPGRECLKITNCCFPLKPCPCVSGISHAPVTLVYGFKNIRNLDNIEGTVKFTIDLLNMALQISHRNLSHWVMNDIWRGLQFESSTADNFALMTGIDRTTTGWLLKSWADCLRSEYGFISIQEALQRKMLKYDFSCSETIKYLAVKNSLFPSRLNGVALNNTKAIFNVFIKYGDSLGFYKLGRCNPSVREEVTGIITTLFFRRISKLALKWSHQNGIPVIFDMNFTYKEARRKSMKDYRPITFSEFCYYKKNNFSNVTESQVQLRKKTSYFDCCGSKKRD